KARTSADKANERLLQAQVDLFLAEGNTFDDTGDFIDELIEKGYLREGEVKSPFGADYTYTLDTNYTVKSTARDKWVEVESGAGGGGGDDSGAGGGGGEN
ncbi:MAG: hypothetical protein WBK48_03610, partial [Dethiobacteria bacterium]